MSSFISRIAALLLLAAAAGIAQAQAFPAKPIRLIVPYQPGGPTDSLARIVGQQVAGSTGQQVLVENRAGASSIIGMDACAKAAPDGYTICLTVGDSLSYNPFLFKTLPYDPYKDFAPVIYLARGNSLIVASARSPFATLKELIAHAKANPGKVNWGTWGASTTPDVYRQWINRGAGVEIVGIPYKGALPTMSGMLSGEIDLTFMSIGFALPQIKAGKLKPIAVVGTRRFPLLPEVPNLAEEGVDPGLGSYFGIFAPAQTPKNIVDSLNAEFGKALRTSALQDFLRVQTLDAVGGSPADFAEFIRNDQVTAGRVFKAIGVRPGDAPS
jgi:tripartite-type tricarboxylate transporter receptor subunit TctC